MTKCSPLPLMILPLMPSTELDLGTSLIPITGVMLLLRALIEGQYVQAAIYAPPVMLVTLGGCLLAIRWAIDQFNKESVLFRESERFDLRLWVTHLVRDRGPTPTVSEAIFGFVLIMLIQFFMSLALPPPRLGVFADLAARIFVSLVVVIALPALLMALGQQVDSAAYIRDKSHAHMVAAVGARQPGEKETLPGGALELAQKLRGKINHLHLRWKIDIESRAKKDGPEDLTSLH